MCGLADTIDEGAEEAEELREQIMDKTSAFRRGLVTMVTKAPDQHEPTWPKETLDCLAAFVEERRPIQTAA